MSATLPEAGAGANDGFYADLPAFDDFGAFTEFDAYHKVPDDWVVMTADVIGSTGAIAEGRYKAVNMVGAAVITAVLNVSGGIEVPFVFGGDGATLVVPGRLRTAAARALGQLQAYADAVHGLGLRAAAVPVARLRAEGLDVRVRKLRLSEGNHLAMLAGGGTERAEAIVKAAAPGDPDILHPNAEAYAPDLDGLSCRWEPLVPRHGRMIALIVQPRQDAAVVLDNTLSAIAGILTDPLIAHAPVSDQSLRFRFPPSGLRLEVLAQQGNAARAWAWALFTAAMQWLAERAGLKIGDYDQPRYRAELKTNTDFRKYDDAFRAVLDVTPAQASAIEAHLDAEFRAGRLVHGVHVAERALMTCLVFSLERSEHVHFVDAAGGGFARAAFALKQRMQEAREKTAPPPGGDAAQ